VAWPAQPVILEVFAWPWLTALEAGAGRSLTFADVPAAAWDALALPGVDAVWLMGVWERSPAARAVALTDGGFRAATAAALPDASPADVAGSPYAVRAYEADRRFGGRAGLAAARAALADRGLRLVLDFVPNHVAPDHAWVTEHPDFFVRDGPAGEIAHGRDPSFPPWPDVLQLDPMSEALRLAAIETLDDIAGRCDGVRCDMAMLVLDDVAVRTWGTNLQPVRPEPYWVEVTRAVRGHHPDFLFLAEAYWDREAVLLEQGIDYCYDKRLYDRLAESGAGEVRAHLGADAAWQSRLVRFLENHDEPRAAAVFAPGLERAASVALMTLPGAILLHEGQLDGARVRLPVHLGRRPVEEPDPELDAFWSHLLEAAASEGVRAGEWRLLDVGGWPDDASASSLLAWRWERHLVVVNFSAEPARGRVGVAEAAGGGPLLLTDILAGAAYERDGDELVREGLYVALPPWGAHVFRVDAR
jgi:hypothetical protein